MQTCPKPIDAIIAITYRCNAKCKMCNIWQIQDHTEISADQYLKLPASLKDINISGGEPFLRSDLIEIIKNIKTTCPNAKLIISTNGIATDLIKQKMIEIIKIESNIGIAVSLDGIGKIHDQIRGIDGAYEKVLATIAELKKIKVKQIKFAFTLTNDNLTEMTKVYDLAQKLKIDFTLSSMQSSDVYFGNKENQLNHDSNQLKEKFNYLITNQIKKWSIKQWVRAYFTFGLYQFILGQGRLLPSEAGQTHFFLDPKGIIYPSVVDSAPIGNINSVAKFEQIWCSTQNQNLRQQLKNGLAKSSWMICTARTAIKKHPLKVGWWVIKNITSSLLSFPRKRESKKPVL